MPEKNFSANCQNTKEIQPFKVSLKIQDGGKNKDGV